MKPGDKQEDNTAAKFLDNLSSFLGEHKPTGGELSEELRAGGVEPDELEAELNGLLSKHAPDWRQKAEKERLLALQTFSDSGPKRMRSEIEGGINQVVLAMQQLGVQISPGAYHQKFQHATDADLESLLDDLQTQLDILKKEKADG